MNKITNIKQNCLGTLSFDGKFEGMRKSQDFIVYPMQQNDGIEKIKIQSNTRIGYIVLTDGTVILSPSFPSGAYNPHLMYAKKVDVLSIEELAGLKFRLVQTASEKAGNNKMKVFCDNSQAEKVSIF